LPDDVANADDLGILGRNQNRQITLSNLQPEVGLLHSLEKSLFDGLDQCGTVMRVNDGLADLECHVVEAPIDCMSAPALPLKGNTQHSAETDGESICQGLQAAL
jgi:hypothetical protein